MPKFKLICDHSCDLDTHVVTHEFTADYLSDVLLNIDMFLKGAGYNYGGRVDTVEDIVVGDISHSEHYFDFDRNR